MRLVAWLLCAVLTGCATTTASVPPEQPPAVACAGKVAVGVLFAPLLVYEFVTMVAVTPIALLIDKDKTVESWKALGASNAGCR